MTTLSSIGETYFSVTQVAEQLGLSRNTITRRFENYPGVIDHGQPERLHKRRYRELRIPQTAVQRYLQTHRVGETQRKAPQSAYESQKRRKAH
jgi:hypothetical protein